MTMRQRLGRAGADRSSGRVPPSWAWSDLRDPRPRGRLFWLSGESLTTLFLWGYALVLWHSYASPDGSTFVASHAFAWLAALTAGNELPWSAAAFALAIVAPLALWFDDGRLRCLSLVLQGLFFGFLAASSFVNNPFGLGWVTFLLSAGWLLARAAGLALARWRTIRGNGAGKG